ncbi:MAG: NADH-quinone oxidoreductase subunit C [Candidatus Nealsonbacteria bacterium]|nr:MAG: NADH-quinone oxidoreductase subunit C [Candidatus Nealsonbacteria bacterium]
MEKLKKNILANFRDIEIYTRQDNRIFINTKKETVLSLLSYLKNTGYDHLALVSCNDWIDDGEFELVYILSVYMEKDEEYQGKEKTNIIIKTRIVREEAKFITVIDIFENAEPYERELHEMFGIKFEGHPRLTTLFLELEYEIPPFRKDFDTDKYVENKYGQIPTIKERKSNKRNERT